MSAIKTIRSFAIFLLLLPIIDAFGAEETPAADTAANTAAETLPNVEDADTLKKLDPQDPIWVSADRKRVVLLGEVCLREGLLELFACAKNSKEHESIVTIGVKPYLIHAALLVIGAKKGRPVQYTPEFTPPEGEKIAVHVRWRDSDGTVRDVRAQEWICKADSTEEMSIPWVFTGGSIGKDPNNKSYYLADVTGELIGVSNFAGTILDVPIESSVNNDELLFEPFTERIPPVGTGVTLVLSVEPE